MIKKPKKPFKKVKASYTVPDESYGFWADLPLESHV